eukprot:scaffold5556_cov39-Cyclotella_meneghiniana.AAC.3
MLACYAPGVTVLPQYLGRTMERPLHLWNTRGFSQSERAIVPRHAINQTDIDASVRIHKNTHVSVQRSHNRPSFTQSLLWCCWRGTFCDDAPNLASQNQHGTRSRARVIGQPVLVTLKSKVWLFQVELQQYVPINIINCPRSNTKITACFSILFDDLFHFFSFGSRTFPLVNNSNRILLANLWETLQSSAMRETIMRPPPSLSARRMASPTLYCPPNRFVCAPNSLDGRGESGSSSMVDYATQDGQMVTKMRQERSVDEALMCLQEKSTMKKAKNALIHYRRKIAETA